METPGIFIRRPLLILGLLLTALTFASGAAALWDAWPGDVSGLRFLRSTLYDYTRPVMAVSNAMGDEGRLLILTGVVAGWLLFQGRSRIAGFLTVMMLLEIAAVVFLKWAVHRPRPYLPPDLDALVEAAGYSFPSGHVTFSVAFFGALAYLLARYWSRRGWRRQGLLGLLLLPVVLIGPARVSWGVHWPSDVVGGYILALIGIQLLVWLDYRFSGDGVRLTSETTPVPRSLPGAGG